MRKIVKQSIDRQIAALNEAGYPPAAVLLSRDNYTEFLRELAFDAATDQIEPIADYQGILVIIAPGDKIVTVVPTAELHWNNAAEVDAITRPDREKSAVRFIEL